MIDGLALGETTPGPLIMVVAFVGFVGGWAQAGARARRALPRRGARRRRSSRSSPSCRRSSSSSPADPLVEATHGKLGFTAPLSAITAAVVGVILNLALFFAYHVLWPSGFGGRFDIAVGRDDAGGRRRAVPLPRRRVAAARRLRGDRPRRNLRRSTRALSGLHARSRASSVHETGSRLDPTRCAWQQLAASIACAARSVFAYAPSPDVLQACWRPADPRRLRVGSCCADGITTRPYSLRPSASIAQARASATTIEGRAAIITEEDCDVADVHDALFRTQATGSGRLQQAAARLIARLSSIRHH